MAKATLVFLAMIAMALMFAQPVRAGALTSTVTDPEGDAILGAQPYQDIVKAAITLKDGRFIFSMELAAALPDTPALPSGVVLLNWLWALNTDSTTFPVGFPFDPGGGFPGELIVMVIWDGTSFTGIVIDRRPLLTGGEAVITPFSPSIKGAKVTVGADATVLGNPSSFIWTARTEIWHAPFGTDAFQVLDFAPDSHIATWPS